MSSPEYSGPPHATTFLEIDLDALASNYRLLGGRAAPARCAAVVKADGYGLGVAPVARALSESGCETFFVAHLGEAVTLRQALADLPAPPEIYVLNGLMPGDEPMRVVPGGIQMSVPYGSNSLAGDKHTLWRRVPADTVSDSNWLCTLGSFIRFR